MHHCLKQSYIRFIVSSIPAASAAGGGTVTSIRVTESSRGGLSSTLPLPLTRGRSIPRRPLLRSLGGMFLKPTYSFP